MNKITIRNYRNIHINNPITLEIMDEGLTFILGANNVGKSNLLKIFFELRSVVAGKGTAVLPNNLFWSNVKNQKSLNNEIVIELTNDNISHSILVTPTDGLDNNKYEFYGNPLPPELSIFYDLFMDSLYISSLRTLSNQTSGYEYDILIGNAFIRTWDEWANGKSATKRAEVRSLKEEIKKILGFSNFNINPNFETNNLIVETDDGSFNLDELGGGISHFIIVLGNALFRKPSYIFIDEPENSLHPKMQEAFVRALASKAKRGLIATSHSIGLARSSGADKIYFLTKNSNSRLALKEYGDNSRKYLIDSINELGFSQFVELGGSNLLLVEGPTDIKMFKEIMRKYGIDQDFIVLDLGGSNLISETRYDELNELKRLNANSYNVIIDSEKSSEIENPSEKISGFVEICNRLGFNVFLTEYHSTDNYITQKALDSVAEKRYKALEKFESLGSRPKDQKWGKTYNWKMVRNMDISDFEGTLLDKYIRETLIPLAKNQST